MEEGQGVVASGKRGMNTQAPPERMISSSDLHDATPHPPGADHPLSQSVPSNSNQSTDPRSLDPTTRMYTAVHPTHLQLDPNSKKSHHLALGLLNARSVCNKTLELSNFICDQDLDVCAITETWLKGDVRDDVILHELVPAGYTVEHTPRNAHGGGIAFIHRDDFTATNCTNMKCSTFEHIICQFNTQPKLRLVLVYRPPSRSHTFANFIAELEDLLDSLVLSGGELCIIGDFNVHVDDVDSREGKMMNDLLNSFDFTQHVKQPTHSCGHTLDLVISRGTSTLSPAVSVHDLGISDHHVILIGLHLSRANMRAALTKNYRCIKRIDPVQFNRDILSSELSDAALLDSSPQELSSLYNSVLESLMNKHAPLKVGVLSDRRPAPWFTDDLRLAKQERRQYERRWLKSELLTDRDAYMEKKQMVNNMIKKAKKEYYQQLILDQSKDPKTMFTTISSLLGKQKVQKLPPGDLKELTAKFSDFFALKVESIRCSINNEGDIDVISRPPDDHQHTLTAWRPVSQDEVHKIILKSATKHCSQDPLPTGLLKQCIASLLPIITAIINRSLSLGVVPDAFKLAHITPLLKKPSFDHTVFSNYRPVSNLPYISKVLERAVHSQLMQFIENNGLNITFQSAYRKSHSTETALVRVQQDILMALSERKACLLVLLDLSSAFDTVDYMHLIDTLHRIGLQETTLAWFKSYLTNRRQLVQLGGQQSTQKHLTSGVPQGSVLGPVLFTLYTSSLSELLDSFSVHHHFYADDTSLYVTFEPTEITQTVEHMERCVAATHTWMKQKMLKLNESKTEVLLISSKPVATMLPQVSFRIGDANVSASEVVRYIGVLLDKNLTMDDYINNVCRSAQFHLFNIGRIRKYLSTSACESLIHAFISSRLDYSNAILYGLPKRQIMKLQRIQNAAARLLTMTRRREHITPILIQLHWLPIEYRIQYKIALIVFKCLNGMAPPYLSELLQPYVPSRNLRSSEHLLLQEQHPTSTLNNRCFSVCGPKIWNSLDFNVRNCRTIDTFKSKLKTFLFRLAFTLD